ncbi:MAG: VTT domain-containing protein [Syntrophotaleaceae bacterium]
MKKILRPGDNCWCLAHAERVAFLVDGEAIFSAFEKAAAQARRSLLIVGWDIDSRVKLKRSSSDECSVTIGSFLENLVIRNPELEIHILIWDYPVIYALDREPLPIFNLDWKTHRRIHLSLDSQHPIGACHHQKIVVVDDGLALAGGFDLSNRRWDTPQHHPDDPQRIDPLGKPYPPFHDVQALVQGPIAGKLGELARERWFRATGSRLPTPEGRRGIEWPESVAVDMTNIAIGIVRTEPAFKNRTEVREVQRLFIQSIAAAEKYIYIENQYLTSRVLLEALLNRLGGKSGPEIIIILPKSNTGWLEENTMGQLRRVVLQSLAKADDQGRLGIFCPVVGASGRQTESEVRIHSKVMIADDTFVRIGSANLNNRSMGLDTECDLALETAPGESEAIGVIGFRNRLLGEHLGVSPEEVGKAIADQRSLLKAINLLNVKDHCLENLISPQILEETFTTKEIALIDPEQPIKLDLMMDQMVVPAQDAAENSRSAKRKLVFFALAVLLLLSLWRFTPLKEYLDTETLTFLAISVRQSPLAWLYVFFAYVVGGLLFFPVTVLIVVTSALFSPLSGFFFSLAGCLGSAALTFAIGHWMGRDTIRHFAGGRLNRISKQIARKGILAIGAVRLVPIAPFTLVNLVAGASHIRFRDFFLGTLAGMVPGIAGLTIVTDRIRAFLSEPGLWNTLLLVALLLLVGAGGYFLKKRLSRQE